VTGIDAGAGVVQFGYSYVDDENNIYRKTFDHRSGDPYNEYSYDDLDRLADVTYHDTDAEAFVMDDLGDHELLLDAIHTMNTMERTAVEWRSMN